MERGKGVEKGRKKGANRKRKSRGTKSNELAQC
jgi:hypothetical protein